MKSKKEIEDNFNETWVMLGKNDDIELRLYLRGWIDALDWAMDEELINKKRNKVIK